MTASSLLSDSRVARALSPGVSRELSADACRAVLERTCFGHLSYNSDGRIDAAAVRFVFVEGWVYFAADRRLRHALGNNSWVVISVADVLDANEVASVIVSGTCYHTERTGSARSDASALRGVVRLREREPAGATQLRRIARTHTVLRLHVDGLRGVTTRLPCTKAAAHNHLSTREGG
jgi:hypothetical protein